MEAEQRSSDGQKEESLSQFQRDGNLQLQAEAEAEAEATAVMDQPPVR